MSHVLNAILTMSCAESQGADEVNHGLAHVNAFLDTFHGGIVGGPFVPVHGGIVGGGKVLECDIALCVFNHLGRDRTEVFAAIESAPWEHPEEVQLFIKDQGDDRFSEVPLKVKP